MCRPRVLLTFMAACLAIAAPAAAAAFPNASADATAIPSRQILVMLKIAPAHFRPGAAYGAGYGDTASLTARRHTAQSIARKNGLAIVDGWPMPMLGIDCYVMRVDGNELLETAIARVSRDPRVAWSEPMQLYQTRASGRAGGDPLYRIEPAAQDWHLADLHKMATGRGVKVAIIDSKVEIGHPDLRGSFIADKNFLGGDAPVAEQQGTAVAGILRAKGGVRGRGT